MFENTDGRIAPLNWRALVSEAIRRRKSEKLTQREHAALASVSIPTIVAFDRGERTLTLSKAFDILRVVGLIEETNEEGPQELFVRDAYARWKKLVSPLPEDSPGRFPDGSYRIDYALEGNLKDVQLSELREMLLRIELRNTGWPMFWGSKRSENAPKEVDGVLESWLSPLRTDGLFRDPAHCDFWRAAPSGRAFLLRGYQEDSDETQTKRTIFDPTLAVWRLSEGLLHASRFAKELALDEISYNAAKIRYRALYIGLTGRSLTTRANPGVPLIEEGSRARGDEAILESIVPAQSVEAELPKYVAPLIEPLFKRFDVVHLSSTFILNEVGRFMRSRV